MFSLPKENQIILPVWVIFSLEQTFLLSNGPILAVSKLEDGPELEAEVESSWRSTTSLNITEDLLLWACDGGDIKFVGLWRW